LKAVVKTFCSELFSFYLDIFAGENKFIILPIENFLPAIKEFFQTEVLI